jgi:hypothetical protein
MRRSVLLALIFFGCTQKQTPPVLNAVASGRQAGVVRIAGPVATYGLLTHLAQTFMDRHRNHTVVMESPLATTGARKALTAGLLEAVVTIESGRSTGGQVFAESQLVFALGPGIDERNFSDRAFTAALDGESLNWGSGVTRKYLKRSIHDPLNQIVLKHRPTLRKTLLGNATLHHAPSAQYTAALARRVANERGAFALALEGNLKLFGIPVWTGKLPIEFRTVSFVIYGDSSNASLDLFLRYILGPQGQASIAELGFKAVTQ